MSKVFVFLSTYCVEEGENMRKSELLGEVMEGINEGYDMYSSVLKWLDDEVFELFDGLLSKGIELNLNDKKLLLNKLFVTDQKFFEDDFNIIYLKLLDQYIRSIRTSGENQKRYYVVDRFSPSDGDIASVVKHMQNVIKEKELRSFIEESFNYDVLLPYKKARDEAKLALETSAEIDSNDTLEEALEVLDEILSIYDKEYIVSMLEDCRQKEYDEAIEKLGIASLAKIYCEVNGGDFSNTEKRVLLEW